MAYMIALLFHTFTFTWYGEMTAETVSGSDQKLMSLELYDRLAEVYE